MYCKQQFKPSNTSYIPILFLFPIKIKKEEKRKKEKIPAKLQNPVIVVFCQVHFPKLSVVVFQGMLLCTE